MIKNTLPICLLGISMFFFFSCEKDNSTISNINESVSVKKDAKEIHKEEFAKILSKVTFANKDVREFLRNEAIKQFDKNYNVLYYLVSDEYIGDKTFREILIDFSSEEEISSIERTVPLINILIPEISFFDISAENLNLEDKDIPVVVSSSKTTDLYLNGKLEMKLDKGEVPDFHVFVVKENDRVNPASISFSSASKQLKTQSIRSNERVSPIKKVSFLSPNFDGNNKDFAINNLPNTDSKESRAVANLSTLNNSNYNAWTDSFYLLQQSLRPEIYEAMSMYFYEDVANLSNPKSKAYQRDFIYYNIKSKNDKGYLNPNVTDYIDYLVVKPETYFRLSTDGDSKKNPIISDEEVVSRKRTLSPEELIDRMWTKGAYEFKFEIFSDHSTRSTYVTIPVKPSDLWNFNVSHSRTNGTMFRSSKNTYRIDPNKFTSKVYYLNDMVPLAQWDISKESLHRYINLSEVNPSSTESETITQTVSKASSKKFSSGAKIGVGDTNSDELGGSVNVNGEVSYSGTTEETRTWVRTFNIQDDVLAEGIRISFYNPVFVKQYITHFHLYSYTSGGVKFSVIPRIQ